MKPLYEIARAPTVKPVTIGDDGGVFRVRVNSMWLLNVVASTGFNWDHVSVSCAGRCPTWGEMELVKRLFFKDDEAVMQLHVPPADHINVHPYTLHLWRPQTEPIPRPPEWMVGPRPTPVE